MKKKILMDVIGILLIALVVVVGYKLSPLLLPRADVVIQPDPACDLQRQACAVTLPAGGSAELAMTPRPIPMAMPFEVQVTTGGFVATRVEVDFSGIDMNMGLNRPQLTPRAGGSFAGQATLPVCITGTMDWQATVLIETGGERIAIPYRFRSGGHE
ncbi:MAG: hypothetical protein JNK80_08220 [Dechloromonas sp.]|nr:hypothetical protein [Dechloromonas sp.]